MAPKEKSQTGDIDHSPELSEDLSDADTASVVSQVEDGHTKLVPPVEFPESVYSTREKWGFLAIISLTAWISTVNIPIYFPTLDLLANEFNVSVSQINVTATVYSLFQGISPIFWASLSDSWGRRPVYFCCALCYFAANIALAFSKNYGQLLGLRILQAFGGASTVSLIGGVVGDISSRKNRGALIGVGQGAALIANCFGPLVGSGVLNQFDSWRAIFWSLAVLAGIVFVLVFLFLPETNPRLVGNGMRSPPKEWYFFMSRSLYATIRRHKTGVPLSRKNPNHKEQWKLPYRQVQFFRWAQLFFQPRVMLVLFPGAIHYTTWYMVLTAQSTVLASKYDFNPQQIGYTYLASGIGTLLASMSAGEIMQFAYRREARYTPVNIYKARLGYAFHASALLIASTLVFGWTLHYHMSFYVPVVMTFLVSIGSAFYLSTTSAILVDLFPSDSAASQSCVNLARCCMCAGGLAAVESMMDKMTIGGTFTFIAGLCLVSTAGIWFAMLRYGYRRSEQQLIETIRASS